MSARRALLVFVAGALGCHGCHDDHPYVPYAIGSSDAAARPWGEAPAATPAAVAPSEAGSFGEEAAVPAPPGLARWALEGAVLDAPAGSVFVSGIVRDFDGDGAPDAFAIARPAEGSDPGQVVYYRGSAGAPALEPAASYAPPATVARNPSCVPTARLVLVGTRTAMAELGVQCPMASSTPDRWVAIVGTDPAPSVRLAATVFDPPGAPLLTLDADVADRDNDGRPDVAFRATLEGGGAPFEPGPKVAVTLAWLDRPAGLSRDTGATESSFSALASSAMARAARAKDAPSVPRFAAQVRALWRAVCADGGTPRLVGVAGTGAIPCGGARALEELGLAEVRAYALQGDALRAILAFDRAERPPAAQTARAKDAQAWLTQLAPVATARTVRAVAAVPLDAPGHELSWGALAFETGGKLIVRSRAGPVRVDPENGDETAAEAGADWPSAVTSPDRTMRWVEAYDPCDGVALHATFASGDDVREVALPVWPPLADRCTGSRGAPARAVPIAWSAAGVEAIVEDEPVLVSPDLAHASALAALLDRPGARGGPLSPDGRDIVVPSGAGLLVRVAGARSRLFRAAELDGTYRDMRDCTVSSDGARVACVRAGKAWVGIWDAP